MGSARFRFALAAAVVVASIGGLIAWAAATSPLYYRTPSELADAAPNSVERFRVAGKVVDGTVSRSGPTTRFTLTDGAAEIDVKTDDVLPDTFGPGVEVVADGALTGSGLFTASTVLAKCPSKFKARLTSG